MRAWLKVPAAVLCAVLAAAVEGQELQFPQKGAIEITVLFPAGSSADVTARLLADGMSKQLGAKVIVVNRPGAGGAIGYKHVAAQKPDGYSVVWNSNSVSTTYHSGMLPFDYRAFDAVARVLVESPVIAVRGDSKWRSLGELVAEAKSRPRQITVGNSGIGSHTHFSSVALFKAAGVEVIDVPFGATQVVPSLLGGQVEVVVQLPAALSGYVKTGQVRLLAALTSGRDPALSDVPTAREQGFDVSLETWRGIAVPKGTPKPVIAILETAIRKTAESPDFVQASGRLGVRPAFMPAEEFGALIAKEDAELARIMQFDRLLPLLVSLSGLLLTLLLFGLLYSLSTSRRRALKIAAQMTQDLKAVSHRLVEVQEAERRLLATELHDRAGPSLTALGINLSIVANSLPVEAEPRLAARLEDCASLVAETVDAMRDVMRELRPLVLDDYGLVAALRSLATRFSRRTGIHVVFDGNDSRTSLPKTIDLALFRIAQEALNNVAKHSKANRVEIAFSCANGAATLRVSDDGVGFDPRRIETSNPGLGLIIMRERAEAVRAKFGLKACPGAGVQVLVESP